MKPLIIMLICAPSHLWESGNPKIVQGWDSLATCEKAAPFFADKFSAWNTESERDGMFSTKLKRIQVLASVECKSFESAP